MCVAEGNSTDVKIESAHAISKVLVTTNPALLSETQRMNAVKPLVWLSR
jgi:hypothetical protein